MPGLTALFEAALLMPHKTHAAPAMCQIAQELSRGIGLCPDLGMAALCLLSPEGSLYGLAAPHPRDPSALLAPWVVEVILSQHLDLQAEAGLAPAAISRVGQVLTRLLSVRAREAEWAPVLTPAGLPSHGVLLHENPVLYAHWLMGHSDVAEHLAVVAQQAVVARLNQLEGQEAEARALHMRKFLAVPARIACQLTAEDLAPDEGDGTPPDLLHIGWKAMRQFGNYSSLSVSTRETYEDNWQAFVLSSPASKKFKSHASPLPRPASSGIGGPGRPKACPIRPYAWLAGRTKARAPAKMTTPEESEFMAQPEVQAYMAEANAVEQERAETLVPFVRAARRGGGRDGRVPEMVSHPSRRSPGAWSPRLCALQLEALAEEFHDPAVYWRHRVLLNLHVHTGLSSAIIETLGVAVQEPARLDEWRYLPEEGRLCVRPRHFLGWPPNLQPESVREGDMPGRERRGGHRPVSDCLSVPLPDWLVAEVNHYLHLLIEARVRVQAEAGVPVALFWPPQLAAVPDFALSCGEVLTRLHKRINARIPNLTACSPGQAAVTFEALYASAGLDPIYRYYINHRKYHHLLLPLWYACVSADELAAHYAEASQTVWAKIREEWPRLRGRAALPEPENRGQVRRPPAPGVWYGNWHCPEPEVVCGLVRELQREDRAPIWSAAGLSEEEVRHNRRMEIAAFRLLALSGLRPFELKRITRGALDLIDRSVAVEGKAHRTGGMGRVLPVPDVLRALVEPMR